MIGILRDLNILGAQLFDSIRKRDILLLDKLQVVCGDVGMDELGIAPEMKEQLISDVSVVFHGAATLNLDASLSEAVNLNTTGTLRMLEFCSAMNNLQVGVYIVDFLEYNKNHRYIIYSFR